MCGHAASLPSSKCEQPLPVSMSKTPKTRLHQAEEVHPAHYQVASFKKGGYRREEGQSLLCQPPTHFNESWRRAAQPLALAQDHPSAKQQQATAQHPLPPTQETCAEQSWGLCR